MFKAVQAYFKADLFVMWELRLIQIVGYAEQKSI